MFNFNVQSSSTNLFFSVLLSGTSQLDDVTVFKPPPFTDNCASDVTLPDTCPAKNGNTMLRPAEKIYNKTTGELIGELPSQMKIMSADTAIGSDQCMMKYNRTWYFLDACYNMAEAYQIYYREDLTPPPLNVYTYTRTVIPDEGTDIVANPAAAASSCTEYINNVLNTQVLDTGKAGCPASEVHYSCSSRLPLAPIVNSSVDACSPDYTNCPNGTDIGDNAGCLPVVNASDGETQCNNWNEPALAPCPRMFARTWKTSDQCNNTREYQQMVYVCATPPCNKEDPAFQTCDGSTPPPGKTGIMTGGADGSSCVALADKACPSRHGLGTVTGLEVFLKRIDGSRCGARTLNLGDQICYSCNGTFDPNTCKYRTGEHVWSEEISKTWDTTNSVCPGKGNSAGNTSYSLIWKLKCAANGVSGTPTSSDRHQNFCYNCAADGTWDEGCTQGGSVACGGNPTCTSLTESSTPKLSEVCTGYNGLSTYTGLLKDNANVLQCEGNPCSKTSTADKATCCAKDDWIECNTMDAERLSGLCKVGDGKATHPHGDIFTGGLKKGWNFCQGNTCGVWCTAYAAGDKQCHWVDDAHRCCALNPDGPKLAQFPVGFATCDSLTSKSAPTTVAELCRKGVSATGKNITINYSGALLAGASNRNCMWNTCGITANADIDRARCCAITLTPCTGGSNGQPCQHSATPTGGFTDTSDLSACGCDCSSSGQSDGKTDDFAGGNCALAKCTTVGGSPCQNGGGISGYTGSCACTCINGYTGSICQLAPCTHGADGKACQHSSTATGHTDGVDTSPCGCSCAQGYIGANCQTPTSGVEVIPAGECMNKANALCPGQGNDYAQIFIKNEANAVPGCEEGDVAYCWNCNAPSNPTTADSFGSHVVGGPGCDAAGTDQARCTVRRVVLLLDVVVVGVLCGCCCVVVVACRNQRPWPSRRNCKFIFGDRRCI